MTRPADPSVDTLECLASESSNGAQRKESPGDNDRRGVQQELPCLKAASGSADPQRPKPKPRLALLDHPDTPYAPDRELDLSSLRLPIRATPAWGAERIVPSKDRESKPQ